MCLILLRMVLLCIYSRQVGYERSQGGIGTERGHPGSGCIDESKDPER